MAAVRAAVEEGKAAAAANDEEGLGSANQHFHGAIVALAGSRRLDTIMSQVLAEMRLFFHKATVDAHFYRGYLPDNEEICTALEAGDLDRAGDAAAGLSEPVRGAPGRRPRRVNDSMESIP